MTNEKIKAVYLSSGECVGSGSDKYKRVIGITKSMLDHVAALEKIHGPLAMLVESNTNYQGQAHKQLVINRGFRNHRQINDADFEIVEII